jgi:hypothetical protein
MLADNKHMSSAFELVSLLSLLMLVALSVASVLCSVAICKWHYAVSKSCATIVVCKHRCTVLTHATSIYRGYEATAIQRSSHVHT